MIYEILGTGAENARTAKDICGALNITPVELRQAVMRERRAGKPICASCGNKKPGYFLAANKKEMAQFCHSLWHRAGEIFKTRTACIKSIDQLPDEQPPEPEESGAAS